jgi:hypothetical protein
MNATRRGTYDHETLQLVETAYARLRDLGITGPLADRIVTGMVIRASGYSAAEAIAAADRLFPMEATRPAPEPESGATEPEPTRQA